MDCAYKDLKREKVLGLQQAYFPCYAFWCKSFLILKGKGFQSSHFTAWDIHKFSGPWHQIKSGLEQQAECVFRFNERYIPKIVKLQSLKQFSATLLKSISQDQMWQCPCTNTWHMKKIVNSIHGSDGVIIQRCNREQKLQPAWGIVP